MEVPSIVKRKSTIFLAHETKAMILIDEKKKMKSKIGVKHENDDSSLFSSVSSVKPDDDENCSSSTALMVSSAISTECSVSISSSLSLSSDFGKARGNEEENDSFSFPRHSFPSFPSLRANYLLVILIIMLADGLQGTHLYVLYEGYGFNVASLYALGFIAGGVTTPITGPLIDKFGRKRSAILYCALEIGINMLEQYPFLAGLLVSRIVGGVTTNLLSSVFETWLDTEFHNRCRAAKPGVDAFARSSDDTTTVSESTNEWNVVEDDEDDIAKNEYELIMRDSVIISNLASIASGYLAHMLAERYGAVGPFRGAVSCTAIAFVVISLLWKENYGGPSTLSCADKQTEDTLLGLETDIDNEGHSPNNQGQNSSSSSKSIRAYIMKGFSTLRADPKILYLGVIQGLSAGSLQLFIFLWSPTLQNFAPGQEATFTTNNLSLFGLFRWAVDRNGEPNYGLIFGAFMAAGVAGGFCAPYIRHAVALLFLQSDESSLLQTVHVGTKRVSVRPMELEFLLGVNYISAAVLMLVPSILQKSSPESFSISLAAFLFYEFLVGVSMTYEGVVRSLHLPSNARATMMMVPRMIVNLAVSLGVLLTKYIATQSAFVVVALLMTCSGILQLSFVSSQEWNTIRRKSSHRARSLSSSAAKLVWSSAFKPKDD